MPRLGPGVWAIFSLLPNCGFSSILKAAVPRPRMQQRRCCSLNNLYNRPFFTLLKFLFLGLPVSAPEVPAALISRWGSPVPRNPSRLRTGVAGMVDRKRRSAFALVTSGAGYWLSRFPKDADLLRLFPALAENRQEKLGHLPGTSSLPSPFPCGCISPHGRWLAIRNLPRPGL